MEGPSAIFITNKPVPNTIDSSNFINKLEELGCATLHPLFIKDNYNQVLKHVEENVKYDSPNKENM